MGKFRDDAGFGRQQLRAVSALTWAGAVLLVAAWSLLGASRPQSNPRFEDFRTTKVYRGPRPKPALDLWHPEQSPINEAIRAVADRPADFGGHYSVAAFSCGTGCTGFVVVDLRSGKSIFSDSVEFPYVLGFSQRPDLPHSVEFKSDSRLLIVHGCPSEEDRFCGSFYYEAVGSRLRLLKASAFEPQPER